MEASKTGEKVQKYLAKAEHYADVVVAARERWHAARKTFSEAGITQDLSNDLIGELFCEESLVEAVDVALDFLLDRKY